MTTQSLLLIDRPRIRAQNTMGGLIEKGEKMTRGVLKNGIFYPVEPLPSDWQDGMEVNIEKTPGASANGSALHPADQWMDEVEAMAAQVSTEEDGRLLEAIAKIRQEAKVLARQGKM